MTNLTALDALIEAVEAGRAIAVSAKSVALAFGWKFPDMRLRHVLEAEAGSLDAAKALHDALLPGWGYVVRQSTNGKPCAAVAKYPYAAIYQYAANPASAWLLAILRAYRAQIGGAA